MKRSLTLVFVLVSLSLAAQFTNPFMNIRHSSRDNSGNLHLRYDVDPELGFDSFQLLYSLSGAWQEADSSQLEGNTMEALVPYEWGQNLSYRLRGELNYAGEEITFQHQAFMPADAFPPSLPDMAELGDDPAGDSLMVYIPDLDIIGGSVASGPGKLFRMLRNQSGSYSTFVNLTTYNIYLCTITNIEALSDSVTYAMIYSFNIPGILSSGLYKLSMSEEGMPDFIRLGNVQSQVVGGALYLSCNMSDLTSDPQFGTWPNVSNTLLFADMTLRGSMNLATMEPEFQIADNSGAGLVEFNRYTYQVQQNSLPILSLVSYDEETHLTELSYTDAELDFPLTSTLYVSDGQGGFMYMDIPPIYNPDGTISFIQTLNENSSIVVSDNGIDFVSYEYSVSNQDHQAPVPSALRLRTPNPISAQRGELPIYLEGLEKAVLTLDLYNLRGQKIARWAELNPQTADLSLNISPEQLRELPAGLYFLSLKQGARRYAQRLVITR